MTNLSCFDFIVNQWEAKLDFNLTKSTKTKAKTHGLNHKYGLYSFSQPLSNDDVVSDKCKAFVCDNCGYSNCSIRRKQLIMAYRRLSEFKFFTCKKDRELMKHFCQYFFDEYSIQDKKELHHNFVSLAQKYLPKSQISHLLCKCLDRNHVYLHFSQIDGMEHPFLTDYQLSKMNGIEAPYDPSEGITLRGWGVHLNGNRSYFQDPEARFLASTASCDFCTPRIHYLADNPELLHMFSVYKSHKDYQFTEAR